MAMAALVAPAPVAGISAGALRCGTPSGPSLRDLRCGSSASAFANGRKLQQQQRCAIKASRSAPLIRAQATAEAEVMDAPPPERFRLGNLSLQPGSRKRNKRKGRGIAAGQGASCGFGMRGQKSRSGSGVRPGFEGGQMPLYRRVPKLKGIAGGHFDSQVGVRFGALAVKAITSSYGGAESLSGDDSSVLSDDETEQADELAPGPNKYRGSLQAVAILAAILGIVSLAALGLTLSSGGPNALLSIVSKSGFPAAFTLIFVSEIGDKTFFIAALLAMRQSKWLVLLGASGALAVMTVISVVIGKLFQRVPAHLQTTLPVGEYAAVALLIWFGLRSIKNAWDIPPALAGARGQPEELGELAEAEEFLKQSDDKKATTGLEVLVEAFTLIFVAEWGDRSMLATIALGAAQSPWGVATGAIAGHVLATLLAVIGGALLARYLSEKLIGYFGGFLFLIFAGATLAGVF